MAMYDNLGKMMGSKSAKKAMTVLSGMSDRGPVVTRDLPSIGNIYQDALSRIGKYIDPVNPFRGLMDNASRPTAEGFRNYENRAQGFVNLPYMRPTTRPSLPGMGGRYNGPSPVMNSDITEALSRLNSMLGR
jgi:hypothetical protein